MPFCPRCKYEYEWKVAVCPDCGARLVSHLEQENKKNPLDDAKSVLLFKTNNYLQAQLLIGALEEVGIVCWAKGLGLRDRLGSGYGAAITHVSYDIPRPAEIYVSPADLDKAKEILKEILEARDILPDDDKIE